MPINPVADRSITCPECHAENAIIGSDLDPSTIVTCSHCKRPIGPYSDMLGPSLPIDDLYHRRPGPDRPLLQ